MSFDDVMIFFLVMNCSNLMFSSCRVEEVGYVVPTPVQNEALPVLFSGRDCVIHAQVNTVQCSFDI